MRFAFTTLISGLLALASFGSAERKLLSQSLAQCQENSSFSANLFDVLFTPDDGKLRFNISGVSTVEGNITIDAKVYAYGFLAYEDTVDPCESDLLGLCPMQEAPIDLRSNFDVPASALKQVPGITYTVPDLDAKIQVYFRRKESGESVACVEAELSNGKTVNQKGVAWTVAVISGLALVASAVTSGLGHSNTAAHVAANTMALFGYFQGQAFIGMTAVSLPPIVSAWTQNFQWSMGIIRIGFIQDIATWYQRATGGTPSTILSNRGTQSVQVQKRALDGASAAMAYAVESFRGKSLMPRTNAAGSNYVDSSNTIVVKGIDRVGYRAGIEETNIFMTGYIFFLVFVFFVVLGVLIFKGICEALTKAGRMQGDKFKDFRNGWSTVLKGIMFRVILIGYPQMVVLCFWQFTQRDSAAIVALAVFTVFTMIGILAWASAKVIRLARRSISMHKSPAYILYSDPVSLNKWGFLYVQFKATAYFFIVPVLIYFLVKGMFVGLGQEAGVVQAIGLLIIEALFLIGVCVMRPYMDKKMNAFNISIAVINLLNTIFLLIFTSVFNQPGLVTGVMGVIFFVYNAVFSLVLIIIVLVASVISVCAKNPDTRYQPMRDDRGSFIKSQSQLNTELDALGATARGEGKGGVRIEDDDSSWSGGSSDRVPQQKQQTAYAPAYSQRTSYMDAPRSPLHSTAAGNNADGRHAPPTFTNQRSASPYDQSFQGSHGRSPPAPPPYSSVPQSLHAIRPAALGPGHPSGPQAVHPAALHAGAPAAKRGGNDELDRVVSMYYDRRLSNPDTAANKNWV